MATRKKTTLIEGRTIACNRICKAIKDKGLPHNSIWLYINHLVHNVDADPNLDARQRRQIIQLCDEYLGIIKDLGNPTLVHKQGLHLLAEITEIQQEKITSLVKEEQHFSSHLLSAISKNLEKFYNTLQAQNAVDTVSCFKEKTLQSLAAAKDKATILTLVEEGFDKVGEAVAANMSKIRHSLDSMLYLESKALIDPLSGILNRRFFDEELPRIIRTFLDLEGKKPFSMLVLDIDNFKEVNDRHGHFVGDVAIQRVSEILQKNCRAGIDAPIRLGGDEFALFLIGTPEDIAVRKAEAIRAQVAAAPIHFCAQDDAGGSQSSSLTLTVSIGVSELQYAWKDAEPAALLDTSRAANPLYQEPQHKLAAMLAESADKALYEAKNQGKNRVCASPKAA
jgi:diguanylate cyclase (GGDEF)-like protein